MNDLALTQQTIAVLLPEFLLLTVAIVMMTAGAFVQLPRRVWSITAAVPGRLRDRVG